MRYTHTLKSIGSYCTAHNVTFMCLRSASMYHNGVNYGVVMKQRLIDNYDWIVTWLQMQYGETLRKNV